VPQLVAQIHRAVDTQDNYGKMIEKPFNYFATIILPKISW
jgi:hypothetical protein